MDPIQIYEDLKEKIIWLDLNPGSTLNLEEISKNYKVSRNPIILALTRLHAEEWVVRNGSHFVVSPLTVDRIREITEIRFILEVQANIWVMHRISVEGLGQLKKLKDDIQELQDGIGNKEIVKLDLSFHRLLYQETRNKQLATMLDRMLSHYLRFWLSIQHMIEKDRFFKETIEMIESIEMKDEVRLKVASTAHIKASLDEVMGFHNLNDLDN